MFESMFRACRTPVPAIGLGLVLFAAASAGAATLTVPGGYPSIQSAINASANGDVIMVSPGTYAERLDFLGKVITVASVSGPAVTIINGGAAGPVVTFQHGEPRAAVLAGFTITNGSNTDGAGVRIASASPTLRGNVITANRGCTGAGVYIYFSSPRLEGNTISQNAVSGAPAGGASASTSAATRTPRSSAT